ncbi:MAG: helix-turn-helix domain-containing protein, partial [Paraclostridium bifermentans]
MEFLEIKDLIKLRRQELGLTYEELGKLVGVGKSTVRKWETGMIENM